VRIEPFARGGHAEHAAASLNELDLQVQFQSANQLRYCWLTDSDYTGRLREAAVFHCSHERLQLSQ
jgi:hypothetical protein